MNQNEKEDENESIIKQEDYFNNSITSWDEMELN